MTTPSSTPAIECRGVSYRVDGREILSNVSFSVPVGGYVGIIGPNGGGKTTLLKLILGILTPTAGEVQILGEPATRAALRSIGYVPQRRAGETQQFPATVEELVRSGRASKSALWNKRTADDDAAIGRAFAIAGIDDLRGRRVSDLSGGQMQKASIARALAAEPKILLLDEPHTGIDQPSRDAFDTFLASLHSRHGLTVIVVSHDLEALSREVDSLLCVNGTVLDHCSPQCFLDTGAFQKLYGERAILTAHHHHH
jgi:zinc transport system ATP-binding protein